DRNAIYPSTFQTLGYNAVVITTNAKEPERIFEFMDWSVSVEATRIYQYGPPGLAWDEVDGQGAPIPNKAYKQMSQDQLDKLELGRFVPFGSYSVREAMAQARELMLPGNKRDWGLMAS
ncbi:MAG TPA: ABC transporter substrate-binding protein, partial [Bacilli bacterium]